MEYLPTLSEVIYYFGGVLVGILVTAVIYHQEKKWS